MKIVIAVFALACAALTAGCVSTGNLPEDNAQPKEAARYNTELGIGYMQQGNNDLAMRKLQRALDEDPDLPAAHSAIALLYERLGEPKLADQHYRRALDLAPDDPNAQNAYGVFLCRHNRVADSEKYFLGAAHNPAYSTPEAAYTNAGVCLLKIGKSARAQQYFRMALKNQPKYSVALWQLARLSFHEHKYLHTRAFLQRLMTDGSTPRAAVLWLAVRNERALGNDNDADRYLRELLAKFPHSHEAQLAMQQRHSDGS